MMLLMLILFVCNGNAIMFPKDAYKAAVVEYATHFEPFSFPKEVMEQNVQEYVKLIKSASEKGASIIVFPEDGLTTLNVAKTSPRKLDNYSIEVPDPSINPNPRINESMNTILRYLSVAAFENKIYVVVNLIEKQRDFGFTFYYNTNIVFDKTGTIILRYRKVNLLNEPKMHPGNELVTFRTDFGVTFGIFTCNDILYRAPALDVIRSKNVTDIVMPSAWYSETPYTQSLSVQAGYARATGVNLLAAGFSHPPMYGGSGIYLHDGSIAELFISPSTTSRLLIQDVPITHVKISAVKCHNNSHTTPRFRLGGYLNEGLINTPHENMSLHTLHALNFHNLETKVRLCSFDKAFCCRFHVILKERPSFHDPKYMLAMFYGVRPYGDTTIGVRSCGLIACLTKDTSSCGRRNHTSRSEATFEKITIKGDFERNYYQNFDMPITLTYDQTPITEYTYCETFNDDKTRVIAEMRSTRPLKNLMSFGIFGRLFDYDGGRVGLITDSANLKSTSHTFIICAFVLFLICR